jgi:hypothetical protein
VDDALDSWLLVCDALGVDPCDDDCEGLSDIVPLEDWEDVDVSDELNDTTCELVILCVLVSAWLHVPDGVCDRDAEADCEGVIEGVEVGVRPPVTV